MRFYTSDEPPVGGVEGAGQHSGEPWPQITSVNESLGLLLP